MTRLRVSGDAAVDIGVWWFRYREVPPPRMNAIVPGNDRAMRRGHDRVELERGLSERGQTVALRRGGRDGRGVLAVG